MAFKFSAIQIKHSNLHLWEKKVGISSRNTPEFRVGGCVQDRAADLLFIPAAWTQAQPPFVPLVLLSLWGPPACQVRHELK